MLLNIEISCFRCKVSKLLLLKIMLKELTLSMFCIVLSLFNFEPTRQFREKMSTKYSFRKERKVFHYHKEMKRFPLLYSCYLPIKSEPTRRFNWMNGLIVLNELFPVGIRQKSFRCLKSKFSLSIILPFEVSKLSIIGIIKIILKGEKSKVNYSNVIF